MADLIIRRHNPPVEFSTIATRSSPRHALLDKTPFRVIVCNSYSGFRHYDLAQQGPDALQPVTDGRFRFAHYTIKVIPK